MGEKQVGELSLGELARRLGHVPADAHKTKVKVEESGDLVRVTIPASALESAHVSLFEEEAE